MKGVLISRSIHAIGVDPIVLLIANRTDSYVFIVLEETLGILEPLVSTTPNETPEISCIEINSVTPPIEEPEDRDIDFAQKLKEILPKLDVNLTELTTHDANKVARHYSI